MPYTRPCPNTTHLVLGALSQHYTSGGGLSQYFVCNTPGPPPTKHIWWGLSQHFVCNTPGPVPILHIWWGVVPPNRMQYTRPCPNTTHLVGDLSQHFVCNTPGQILTLHMPCERGLPGYGQAYVHRRAGHINPGCILQSHTLLDIRKHDN